jgi:hypothetical protein
MSSGVRTKEENFRLWTTGAFGNRLRAWRTVADWRRSDFGGRVSLRYLGLGGGFCRYDLRPDEVDDVLREWVADGAELGRVMVNEGAPDDAIVVQGEYLNDVLPGAVEAFVYSRVRSKMREAFASERIEVPGLLGRFLLHAAMTPSSWADFEVLLERYPGHVLEVSVYARCLGDVPGRNALVWEVRRY